VTLRRARVLLRHPRGARVAIAEALDAAEALVDATGATYTDAARPPAGRKGICLTGRGSRFIPARLTRFAR